MGVGFHEFDLGTRLEQIELGAHIFTGSRNLNRSVGTGALGNGRMLLQTGTFGINMANPSSNFAVHTAILFNRHSILVG